MERKEKTKKIEMKKNWCNSYATMCCGVYTWAWLNTELVCVLWLIQLYAPNIVLPARSFVRLLTRSLASCFVRSFVQSFVCSLGCPFARLLPLCFARSFVHFCVSIYCSLACAYTLVIHPLPLLLHSTARSLTLSLSFVRSLFRRKKGDFGLFLIHSFVFYS